MRQKRPKKVTPVKKKVLIEKQEHRLNAKRFYLTYAKVPESLTSLELLTRLQAKLEFSQYVIGEERNKNGGKHFHAVLFLKKRKDVRTSATFNIEFEGVECSCHCEKVTNLDHVVRYTCKEKKVLSNIKNLHDGVILSVTNKIVKMSDEAGVSKAMLHYMTKYPDRAFSGRSAITLERSLKRREELKRADLTSTKNALSTPFSLKDFDLPARLLKWIEKGCQPTLIKDIDIPVNGWLLKGHRLSSKRWPIRLSNCRSVYTSH
jgi:hypothetical protein